MSFSQEQKAFFVRHDRPVEAGQTHQPEALGCDVRTVAAELAGG